MGSFRTNVTYNEFTPKERQQCRNIYAISYVDPMRRDGVASTSVLDRSANLSLAIIVRKFVANEVSAILSKYPRSRASDPTVINAVRKKVEGIKSLVKDENGMWVESVANGGITGAIQVLYDARAKVVHPIGYGYSSVGTTYDTLVADVVEWIRDELGEQATVAQASSPVPFMDYEVHSLCEQDFPGIYSATKRIGIKFATGDLAGRPVLLADFSNGMVARLIKDQLGKDERNFIEREKILSIDKWEGPSGETEHGVRLTPPYLVVNSAGKSVTTMTKTVIHLVMNDITADHAKYEDLIAGGMDEDDAINSLTAERFRDICRLNLGFGTASFGDLMYSSVREQMSPDGWMPVTQEIEKIMQSLGLSGQDVARFLSGFMNVRAAFDIKSLEKKVYYYTLSVDSGFQIRNKPLFDKIFSFVSEISPDLHLVSSYFCLPPEALAVFGYAGIRSLKEYDPSLHTLSLAMQFARDTRERQELSHAESAGELTKIKSMVGEVIDVSTYPGHVINILTIPSVYAECKRMFDARDVEFSNIPIVLLMMSDHPEIGGGYISPRNITESDGRRMMQQFAGFKPPLIMINMSSEGMDFDKVSDVIIHEVSHYIDDLLVMSGRRGEEIMAAPPIAEQNHPSFLKRYLETPTEETAHMMMIINHLRQLDPEYIRHNRNALMRKLVQVFIPPVEKYVVTKDRAIGDRQVQFDKPIPSAMVGASVVIYPTRISAGDGVARATIDGVSGNSATMRFQRDIALHASDGPYMTLRGEGDDDREVAAQEGYYNIVNKAIDAVLANALP
jgi:hypothetical protein